MSKSNEDIERQIKALEGKVKLRMTKGALERYGRVKMAHPQVAYEALAILAQMVNKGTQLIDEHTLKALLKKIKV
jgi:DNA-binding TFAR19-related protein (PDSD5 family)